MSHPAHTRVSYHPPPPAPWMAPDPIPGYYHLPTFSKRVPWSSDVIRGGTTMKRDCVVQRTIMSTQQKGLCIMFWTSLKGFFRPVCAKKSRNKIDEYRLQFVPYDRRNTYFSESLPAGNRLQVRNSTFRCSSSVTIDKDDFWKSIRHTDDAQHREHGHWPVGGIDHAILHPHSHSHPPPYAPTRIDIQFPTTPFSNVRLNPYLEHHCNGPHPISFDITLGPEKIMHASTSTPLDPASFFKRLATHPPVKRMHLQGVAEDPLPHFPWPIEVENARGITCGDVLGAIATKFLEYVGEGEYNTWTTHRREIAARTYHQRVRTTTDGPGAVRDGLRRIDYMGGKVVFHGLEQTFGMTGDTWFMYVGASERNEM